MTSQCMIPFGLGVDQEGSAGRSHAIGKICFRCLPYLSVAHLLQTCNGWIPKALHPTAQCGCSLTFH